MNFDAIAKTYVVYKLFKPSHPPGRSASIRRIPAAGLTKLPAPLVVMAPAVAAVEATVGATLSQRQALRRAASVRLRSPEGRSSNAGGGRKSLQSQASIGVTGVTSSNELGSTNRLHRSSSGRRSAPKAIVKQSSTDAPTRTSSHSPHSEVKRTLSLRKTNSRDSCDHLLPLNSGFSGRQSRSANTSFRKRTTSFHSRQSSCSSLLSGSDQRLDAHAHSGMSSANLSPRRQESLDGQEQLACAATTMGSEAAAALHSGQLASAMDRLAGSSTLCLSVPEDAEGEAEAQRRLSTVANLARRVNNNYSTSFEGEVPEVVVDFCGSNHSLARHLSSIDSAKHSFAERTASAGSTGRCQTGSADKILPADTDLSKTELNRENQFLAIAGSDATSPSKLLKRGWSKKIAAALLPHRKNEFRRVTYWGYNSSNKGNESTSSAKTENNATKQRNNGEQKRRSMSAVPRAMRIQNWAATTITNQEVNRSTNKFGIPRAMHSHGDDTLDILFHHVTHGSGKEKFGNRPVPIICTPPRSHSTSPASQQKSAQPTMPEVLITMAYSPLSGNLSVKVVRGRYFSADLEYCEIQAILLYDGIHSSEKHSNPYPKPAADPTFNSPFSFVLPERNTDIASLALQFWAQKRTGDSFEIGAVEFCDDGPVSGAYHWAKVQQTPNLPFPMWHKLVSFDE